MTTTSTGQADAEPTISAATLREWPNPLVVDVRSAAEFEAQHIHGSYHVPLGTLAEHTTELARHLETPPLRWCSSASPASPPTAAAGGTVVIGRKGWAMERQVRLVAGSLPSTGR